MTCIQRWEDSLSEREVSDPAHLRRAYFRGQLTESGLADVLVSSSCGPGSTPPPRPPVVEPNAIQLATVSADGRPSVRTVLVKALDERGIVFYTNYDSAKAADLAANPWAAAVFAWLALERQVRLSGPVEQVSRAETEAYFASRPRGSQLGAWASPQSAVVGVAGRARGRRCGAIEAASATARSRPPPNWGGYLLRPELVEFWQGRADRLHDRLRYRRATGPSWVVERLGPVSWPGLGGWLRHHAADLTPTRHPAYRRLLIGQATAFIGSMLTQVAVPVQVYDISHSSLQVGFVGLAGLVPIVAFGLYGGAIADAVDRRTLYFWSSLGTWAVTLALLVQAVAEGQQRRAAARAGRGAVGRRSRSRRRPAARSSRASSRSTRCRPRTRLTFTAGNIGQVVGPLIAGVLVTQTARLRLRLRGRRGAVHRGAVLGAAAAADPARRHASPSPGCGRWWTGCGSSRPARCWSCRSASTSSRWCSRCRARCSRRSRPQRFHGNVGPLYAAIAIGALVAGVSGGWIGRIRRQGVALTGAVVAWGICVAVSGLAHQLWLVVVLLAFAGGADLVSAVYRQTILQTYAPDQMRGRMQGVFIAVVAGGPRLGDVRAGATAAATGVTFSWVAGGVACAVLAAIAGLLGARVLALRRPRRDDGDRMADSAAGRSRPAADRRRPTRRPMHCRPKHWKRSRSNTMALTGTQFELQRGRVRRDRRRGRRRAAPVHLPRHRRHRALRRGRAAAERVAATCSCRGRTGCAAATTPSAGSRYQLALTEPAQAQRDPRAGPLGALDAAGDRAGLGDARRRPGAADRLAVRGAGRGDLHAAAPTAAWSSRVARPSTPAAGRPRSAPASTRTCRPTGTASTT